MESVQFAKSTIYCEFSLCLVISILMKYFIILFLFSISLFAQTNQNISVVSVEKLNVVYRGVANPIKIAVPGVASAKISVSAPGLKKGEGEGNYILMPPQGNEVTLHLSYKTEDDTFNTESKVFRILNVPKPIGTINGDNCSDCIVEITKNELFENEIEVSFGNFLFEVRQSLYVRSFDVIFPDGTQLFVRGNVLDQNAKDKITLLKKGDIIIISQIIYYEDFEGVDMVPAVPIKIMLLD